MNEAVLISEIKELLQAKAVSIADNTTFEGIQVNLTEVRGGELFIAENESDARAALERGAVACISCTELDGCLTVSNLDLAIKQLARWWRERFDVTCVLVQGAEAELVATVLARLLLKKGRGTYTANKLTDNYRAVFNLKNTSEWYIAASYQEPCNQNELLDVLTPSLIVNTDGYAADETIYYNNEGVCLGDNHLYQLEVQSFDALFGSKFSLNGLPFESALLGKRSPIFLSLAVAAALKIFPDFPKEQLQSIIKRFNVLPGELNLRMSCRGRYIIDGSCLSGEAAEKRLFEVMADVRSVSDDKSALVIPASYAAREDFVKQLLEYEPSEVIAVGLQNLAALKDSALSFFQTQSVNATLNLISKSDIRYLYILGIQELTEKILEMEGEAIPEPL